jgi:hypothetical protein
MATLQGSAALSVNNTFSAMPQSLFDLLQNLMDMEQWDPTTRTAALALLVAYHAATSNDDQFHSTAMVNQIHLDSLLLLNHMYGIYSSGIYGVFAMPADKPPAQQLSEVLVQVATTRTAKSKTPLPGPKQ